MWVAAMRTNVRMINEPEANQEAFVYDSEHDGSVRSQIGAPVVGKRTDSREGCEEKGAHSDRCIDEGIEGKTYSLFLTTAKGATSPIPITKLKILDTRVSKPAMMNSPPNIVEPT